jgi:copper resistance protein B
VNRALFCAGAGMLAFMAVPAMAQDHGMMPGMAMPGMTMPAAPAHPIKPAAKKTAPPRKAIPAHRQDGGHPAHHAVSTPAEPTPAAADHASAPMTGMDHAAMQGMDMSGSGLMPGMVIAPRVASGTALAAGSAPPPAPPSDHYADHSYPMADMDRARTRMMAEQGGRLLRGVLFNLAEVQPGSGPDRYRWDGEAWLGGDLDRLVVKSEGEGAFGRRLEAGEVQALYSRAISTTFDVQAGVRQDIGRSPRRTYATLGVEGLTPYRFEMEAALFLSDKGDLLARWEGWYDERIVERLILQPRVELNFAAQDVRADGIGAGLDRAELGLRLRYELTRTFAPYIGVSHEQRTGHGAAFARSEGEDVATTRFVAGVRAWF